MAWARFTANYDHRWPSRAVSAYRADGGVDGAGLYNVKAEVLASAIEAGKATKAGKPATSGADEPERKAADSVAVLDPAQGGDDAPGDELEPDDGDRTGVRFPDAAGA